MINLIPNEEKKKMVKDFYIRLLIVLFFILGASTMVAFGALLPSYFLVSFKNNMAAEKLAIQKNGPDLQVNQKTLSEVANLNQELTLIESSEKDKYYLSLKVINQIVLKKMSDIKITSISYENDLKIGKSVRIRGLAGSRERLLLFRRALEDDIAFKSVDLPISNFVKGSNISFSLTLIPS